MSDEKENKTEEKPKYELKVSRMDPMNTYSVGAVAAQLAEAMENAERFQADADAFYEQAKAERVKMKQLQKLIVQLNERDKQRAKEAKNTEDTE